MSLAPGTKLGPYEIGTALGAGGMGEVYRARDTRLERSVAIKVLPPEMAADGERRQRFEREARTISSLNHAHICALYDVGNQDDIAYIVLEYVEGETLEKRLARGPLSTELVQRYGSEIADALEKAHRSGIVHRDLKPANVMLTRSGTKLLDFGLAKWSAAGAAEQESLKTMTAAPQTLTEQGAILGTFQYMAPEQLEGKGADARTDLFALGTLLYEMATGCPAFSGKSKASLIAAILLGEPAPMSSLKSMTPPALERLVRGCLAKDPDERWQTAHDVKLQLRAITDDAAESGGAPAVATSRTKNRERLAWVVAGVALVAAAALAFSAIRTESTSFTRALTRTYILPPEKTTFHFTGVAAAPIVISPDGKHLVFGVLGQEPRPVLWVRSLDSLSAEPLRGTEGAMFPFWSPDGQYVGFFADGKLKKVDIVGGAPETVCDARVGRGGTWSPDGTIVFASYAAAPLSAVSASGGTPRQLTTLDTSRAESSHRWPEFLPDGRHFLFLAENQAGGESDETNAIYIGSLDSAQRARLISAKSNPVYANGYILYIHSGTLYGLPFDAKQMRVRGQPKVLEKEIQTDPAFGRATFSASQEGTLVYGEGDAGDQRQMGWYDLGGRQLTTVGTRQRINGIRLSPDGNTLAATVDTGRLNLWLFDTMRKTVTPFTSETGTLEPVWSPDGRQILYQLETQGLYTKASDGSRPEELVLKTENSTYPTDWSRDGKYALVTRITNKLEVWALPMTGERKLFPVIVSDSNNTDAHFSPDGNWIVYDSPESGRSEIYVTKFPGPGPKYQVSISGGDLPLWSRDGHTIYYLDSNRSQIMATGVEARADNLHIGEPRPVFASKVAISYFSNGYSYDVAPDGKRFLIVSPAGDERPSRTVVVTNWPAVMKP